jgi:hypothetical protein
MLVMSKIKKVKTFQDRSLDTVQQLGIVLMAAATLLGVVEIPEHNNRLNMITQPTYTFAAEHFNNGSTLRREREESAPHYISYETTQRTPARSGKA